MKVSVNARFLTQRVTGAQRYALEVSSRLPQHGLDVTFLTPRAAYQTMPSAPTRATGRLQGHAWEQLELPGALGGQPLFSPCNVGPLAVRRQVITIHDLFAVLRPEWVSPAFHRWYSWLLPRLARRAAHIVTVSEYSKAAICRTFGVPAERVTVTPLGVSPQFRPPTAAEAAQVRARFELPERFVLALGSLEPRKNLAGAVAAWQRLPAASRPPLVIAGGLGKAAVFGRYDASALKAGGARFLGYVPDEVLPALYGAATLFIYPSFEEGFGLPPVEALACGARVLTSNTSALREFCAPYATLVDPTDPDAIAVALREALERSESAAEKAARAQAVSARFTWEATTAGLAEVLLRYC